MRYMQSVRLRCTPYPRCGCFCEGTWAYNYYSVTSSETAVASRAGRRSHSQHPGSKAEACSVGRHRGKVCGSPCHVGADVLRRRELNGAVPRRIVCTYLVVQQIPRVSCSVSKKSRTCRTTRISSNQMTAIQQQDNYVTAVPEGRHK